jgi:hypothetical protein
MTKKEYLRNLIQKRLLTENFQKVILKDMENATDLKFWFEDFLTEFYAIPEYRDFYREQFNNLDK